MVGSFVMVCLIGLFIATIWLTGAQYRQEFAYFTTFFNGPVTGLGRGTIVRYNGIDAGRVTDLAFDQTDPKRVIATVQLDPTLKLHDDSVASIEIQGFAGGNYVEITGGTAEAPLLMAKPGQQYPVIPSMPSTLQQLEESGPQLVNRFNIVGERVSDVLNDENRKAVAEMLANLRSTTEAIDSHSKDIEATLSNLREATGGITKTLGNVDHTLATADQTLGAASKALASVDTTVTSLSGVINSADSTVQKLGRLSDDTDKVISGEGIAQMTQLLAQTRVLIASLTRLANDFEREPTRLIYGDQRQGYTPK
jgi:phospholipid/cholesterol/gamma-HCH transport system substrate-binding protein